jgi:cholesterol transport system auxiliary component
VTNFPRGLTPAGWSLVVDEPTAARQIDTSRIALMSWPFRVEYYADVEWTDTAAAMVQLWLIQSFQNTGRLPVVAPTRQTLATDFLLLSNLRKFQVEFLWKLFSYRLRLSASQRSATKRKSSL